MGFATHLKNWQRRLLAAVAPGAVDQVLSAFKNAGFAQAAVIGTMKKGAPNVVVIY